MRHRRGPPVPLLEMAHPCFSTHFGFPATDHPNPHPSRSDRLYYRMHLPNDPPNVEQGHALRPQQNFVSLTS